MGMSSLPISFILKRLQFPQSGVMGVSNPLLVLREVGVEFIKSDPLDVALFVARAVIA